MTWVLYGLLSAFFASLVAIFAKIGLPDTDPTLATTVRSIIMAVFLVVVSLSLNKLDLQAIMDRKTILFIVLSGLAGATSWLFYFWALKVGPTTAVAVLDRLSVVFVAILAALFLGESLTLKSIIGVLLMVGGAMVITLK